MGHLGWRNLLKYREGFNALTNRPKSKQHLPRGENISEKSLAAIVAFKKIYIICPDWKKLKKKSSTMTQLIRPEVVADVFPIDFVVVGRALARVRLVNVKVRLLQPPVRLILNLGQGSVKVGVQMAGDGHTAHP